ncbi:MAG: GGDEF domain-containing protein, partial [Planctomycetes bacterium]|nr:GGDEF domain-containing protein [Planctomycetota bacterium]
EELEMEMYRAGRYQHPLGLLLVELDNYHTICEEHGNNAGERVLAEIGKIMLDELRASDKASRWGENQFAILLVNTPKEKARTACNRLWRIISDKEFKSDSRSFHVAPGFSLISVSPQSKATLADLLKLASQALDRAKNSGGSEVIKFEEEI